MFSLLAGIIIVTLEIYRGHSPWMDSFVTIWWAACALTMAVTGLVRRRAGGHGITAEGMPTRAPESLIEDWRGTAIEAV